MSMVAIKEKQVYQICVIRAYGTVCVNNCGEKLPYYDSFGYNNCEDRCDSNIFMYPNNICIEECDESNFTKIENRCSLCRDIDKNNKFKVFNSSDCLPNIIPFSYFMYEPLYIIACKDGYNYENKTCIPIRCHRNCDGCLDNSELDSDQKCIKCRNDSLLLEEGNCVEKCSAGFYLVDNKCERCDANCETCDMTAFNCTSCIEGRYLNTNNSTHTSKCLDCSSYCKNCSKGVEDNNHNCLSCKEGSGREYLLDSNCIEICPETMITSEKKECFEPDKKGNSYLMIFMLSTGLLLLIILIVFYKKICSKRDDSIEDIKNNLF